MADKINIIKDNINNEIGIWFYASLLLKEQDIENQVMQADLLGLEVSSDIVDEYAKIRSTKKIVQFETEMCNYQHSLETKVEELSNSYSYNLN